MTITPMPVLPPATRGGGARTADAKTTAADDFAAVLDGQLAGSKAAGPTAPAAEQDKTTTEAAPDVALEALLAGTVAVAATPVAAVAVPTGTGAGTVPPATAVPEAVPGLGGTPTAAVDETGTDETGTDQAATGPDLGMAVPAGPEPAGTQADAHPGTSAPQTPAAMEGLPGVPMERTAPAADASAAETPVVAEEVDTPLPAPTSVGVSAPVTPTPSVTPVGAPAAPAPTSPVLAQVTPALARVVTRGDGEHRMMLKLHPADLGEVHLTVTVRGDHVDVEIAAGAAARDVLREGSAHLRSLLESIGRSTGQFVLRDLPVTPTHAAGPGMSAGQDNGAGTSYADTGAGRRDQPDTRGGRGQAHPADQPLDRPPVTPRASGRTTVPGASALDVTV